MGPTSNITSSQAMGMVILETFKDLLLLLFSLLNGPLRLEDLKTQIRDAAELSRIDGQDSATPTLPEEKRLRSPVSALCRALALGDVEQVTRLLDAAPSLATLRHDKGWSPIHTAILTGELELVKLILAKPGVKATTKDECDPSSESFKKDPDGTRLRTEELGPMVGSIIGTKDATPLHYACMVGRIDIIKLLLDHEAHYEAKDEIGRWPLEYFNPSSHRDEMATYHRMYSSWLKRHREESSDVSISQLENAIKQRDLESFERQLRRKPGLTQELTYYDFTLLQMATIRQLLPFVELILSIDSECINKKDNRYTESDAAYDAFASKQFPHKFVRCATPLHYACLTGNTEIIDVLLKAGADWTIEDHKGKKPKDFICEETGECTKCEFKRLCDEEDERRKAKQKQLQEEEEEERKKKEEEEREKNPHPEDRESSELKDNADKAEDSPTEAADSPNQSTLEISKGEDEESAEPQTPPPPTPSIEAVLAAKIIGQKGPIRSVANAIRLRENGWVDPDRPLVMLFLGSSGVGKTELAKQVALYLHGKDGVSTNEGEKVDEIEGSYGFVRIDMSEYQHKHTVSNLTGPPKGYVGYDDEGCLTRPLRKNPKAIVLFDEIEKAHPDVLTVFLQLFDDGRITDTKRGVIYCKDAVFIMTSNLASDEIKAKSPFLRKLVAETEARGKPEEYMRIVNQFNRDIHPILKQNLKRDEFLGRINQIVVFLPLDEAEIALVINGELDIWRKRAEEKHGIKLSWCDEAVVKLAQSYDVNYGVRSVMHEVQRIAVQLIADAQIRGELNANWLAYLTVDDAGDVVLKAANPTEGVKFRRGCRYDCV